MPQLNSGPEKATFLPPDSASVNPVGFVAPAILQSHYPQAVKDKMAIAAAQLVDNPNLMRLFCDRVYQLLQDDLDLQHERTFGYGRR